MGEEVIIRTHKSLKEELSRIRCDVRTKINKNFNGVNVQVPSTIASQIAAKRLQGRKEIQFEIERHGLNRGKIKLL